jgi:hypothetical protein
MPASAERILTTHVGSLVRPAKLVRYIEAMESGLAVDRQAFDALLRQSVHDVVRRQHQAGIDVVSDGEYGKFRSWSFYVLDRLGGIEERDLASPVGGGRDRGLFPESAPTAALPSRRISSGCTSRSCGRSWRRWPREPASPRASCGAAAPHERGERGRAQET